MEHILQNLNRPFIGITDFTSSDQILRMRSILDLVGSNRVLAAGVMMSYKTLKGIDTKWAKAWPPKEEVASIFVHHPKVMNVLHYADYDDETTAEDLMEAIRWAEPEVNAVQLDMIWPSLAMLETVKKSVFGRRLKFIIQVNERAIEYMQGNPNAVAEQLRLYKAINCLDYALFDMSMGQGKPLEATRLMSFMWCAVNAVPDLAVAVAGGLGPHTMHLAEPVIRDFPDVSIDAQSKLRPSGNALDPIDWAMAEGYIRAATDLFRKQTV